MFEESRPGRDGVSDDVGITARVMDRVSTTGLTNSGLTKKE